MTEGGFDPDDAQMGGLIEIVVADDPQQAAARILPHWLHQQNTYRATAIGPGPSMPTRPGHRGIAPAGSVACGSSMWMAPLPLGEAIDAVPARHAYTWLSVGDMPADLVERHVELWCGPVRSGVLQRGGGADERARRARWP